LKNSLKPLPAPHSFFFRDHLGTGLSMPIVSPSDIDIQLGIVSMGVLETLDMVAILPDIIVDTVLPCGNAL
jgi:hypothetical protein